MTSILHRATGCVLTIALIAVTALLYCAANDPGAFDGMTAFLSTGFGIVVLTGFVLASCYHFCSGLRHLIFDTGAMLDLKSAYALGYLVLAGTAVLTVLLMICILSQIGVLDV